MSWVLTVVLAGRDDDREYLFDERPEIRSEYGPRTVEYSGEYEGRRLEVLVTVENAATVVLERVGDAEELEKAQGEGPGSATGIVAWPNAAMGPAGTSLAELQAASLDARTRSEYRWDICEPPEEVFGD